MTSALESASLDKAPEPRIPGASGTQAATVIPATGFDPFVVFARSAADPANSAADSLSFKQLKAPVLQRAQRLYGNRATQQIVMRTRVLQRECKCGGSCAKCQAQERQRALQGNSSGGASVAKEERRSIQPKSAGSVPTGFDDVLTAEDDASAAQFDGLPSSSGEPLDRRTRVPLEAHFGADLTNVRLHTDAEAAESATKLDALAYTSGREIYFAAGMYAPASNSGQRLLAHEVAHVIQQSSGREPTIAAKSSHGVKIGAPDDSLENDAERSAEEFMSGAVTDEEERKKREGTSPVQRFIQRQADRGGVCRPETPTMSQAEPLMSQPENPLVCTAGDEEHLPPDPGPKIVTFGGYILGTRPEYLRSILSQVGNESGLQGMDWFVSALELVPFTGLEPSTGTGQGAEAAYTPDEIQLIGEIAPVMRSELVRLKSEYLAFGDFVRNAAVVRLTRNHHNLGLWRDYVQSLDPPQVMGMAVSSQERPVLMEFLHSRAQGPFKPMDVYERRAWSASRFEREYLERLGTGQIHGGCEQCHEQKLARDMEYHSPTMGEAAIPLAVRIPQYVGLNVATPPPQGKIASPDDQPKPLPDWTPSAIGNRPGAQAIAASLPKIRDYLKPLGDSGYRIITNDMITDATDGSALVASVLSTIDTRRQGYLDLIGKIEKPDYNFLEPLRILQELLPFADPDVRAVVAGEMRLQEERKKAEATEAFILGIAAMLLTIFPPTAPIGLAMGAGLAVWGLASAYDQWQQGTRFEEGRGGGVFTPEQEDSARALRAMAVVNMVLSAFALVDAGVAGARLLRGAATGVAAAGAAGEVVGAEATAGGLRIRIEGLEGASPRVTVTHPDGTIERFTTEELEAMLSETTAAGAGGRAGGGGTESQFPLVPQKQPNWCGAACGEMAAGRLGGKVTQEELAAHRLFTNAEVIEGQVVRFGGFDTAELRQALEELAPVAGRRWLGVDLAGLFKTKNAGELVEKLGQVLADTKGSIILRVKGGSHWIVVDEVLADGTIAIRNPAAKTSQILKPGELASMDPIGHAVISLPQ